MNDTGFIVDTTLRHAEGRTVFETPLPRLTLFHALAPTEPVPAFYQPSFCAIVQGRKTVRTGVRDIAYGAGQYLVAGFDVPVVGAVTAASDAEPYVCVQLTFDREILIGMREDMPDRAPIATLGIAETGTALLSAIARLVGLLDQPDDAAFLAPLYEREILYRLLSGPHGAQLRRFAIDDDRAAPVERAIAFLQETYVEDFKLERLLAIAGRSQSSLYRDFKKATGLSPLKFRTRLRLQEVRRLMLAEHMGAADAGFAVGYDSPSQLSREYSRLYGCPPVEDVRRMKSRTKAPCNEETR